MIRVTKTFLPPREQYQKYLEEIWNSNQIANGGKLWFDLQAQLQEYLNSPNLILTANGTLPLQIALKRLAGNGEVITTPFSYVATTSSIVWENCEPVFVDIHPDYLTIDETKIEAAITGRTTAILATHVFGNPCHVEEIQRIATKYNLKVIYDAAHCFGVKYNGKSIFEYGDVSTCSFHATKIFHTGEGGALFCKDPELYSQLFYSHNFGHMDNNTFYGPGINAKMSELQAAMGLAVLPHLPKLLKSREEAVQWYDKEISFSTIHKILIREGVTWNFSYYPIILRDEKQLLKVLDALSNLNIFPRRYFYPSLNKLSYVKESLCEVSEDVARRVLCLPLNHEIQPSQQKIIVKVINRITNE
jgi:dTDP-4-amino-4,6-dideoxygalactose transaminase